MQFASYCGDGSKSPQPPKRGTKFTFARAHKVDSGLLARMLAWFLDCRQRKGWHGRPYQHRPRGPLAQAERRYARQITVASPAWADYRTYRYLFWAPVFATAWRLFSRHSCLRLS